MKTPIKFTYKDVFKFKLECPEKIKMLMISKENIKMRAAIEMFEHNDEEVALFILDRMRLL